MNIFDSIESLPFGKFERFTAGFCMAIPFILIIVDQDTSRWMLLVPLLLILLLQFVPQMLSRVRDRNHGVYITVVGSLILFLLYLLFSLGLNLRSKPSISLYVTMVDGHIFGMLLGTAAMLFLANGFAFRGEKKFTEANWRSYLNIFLGLLLSGVIIFRCDKVQPLHNIIAVLFFLLCAYGSLRRSPKRLDENKIRESKKVRAMHRGVDFLPVIVMAVFLLLHFLQKPGQDYELFSLFTVESIALWITGMDFILISLKRDRVPAPLG